MTDQNTNVAKIYEDMGDQGTLVVALPSRKSAVVLTKIRGDLEFSYFADGERQLFRRTLERAEIEHHRQTPLIKLIGTYLDEIA